MVKMAKLQWVSAAFCSAALCFTSLSVAQTVDIQYLKTKDPELYRRLMAAEQCRQQPQLNQCQTGDIAQQSAVSSAAAEPATPAEAPKAQGKWWYASSYENKGPYPTWLHATQLTADLISMNGNTEGEQFHIELDYFSRINAWTNYLTLIYQKDDVKQSDIVALDTRHYAANYGGRFDVNSTWYGQGGYIVEKDTSQSIDRQQVYYLGAGAHLLNREQMKVNTMLALGRQDDNFINVPGASIGIDSLNYSVAYFVEQLSWSVSKSIHLNQSFSWLYSLEHLPEFNSSLLTDGTSNPACLEPVSNSPDYCITDRLNKSKLEFTLELEYQINAYISLLYNYAYERYNLPWIGVEGTDTTNSLSIRARFQ
jgi:hypothetical protein